MMFILLSPRFPGCLEPATSLTTSHYRAVEVHYTVCCVVASARHRRLRFLNKV